MFRSVIRVQPKVLWVVLGAIVPFRLQLGKAELVLNRRSLRISLCRSLLDCFRGIALLLFALTHES